MRIKGLSIIRPVNCIISIIGVFLGAYIVGIDIPKNIFSIFLTSLSPFFITAFGNIHNDIIDYDLDSIEKRNRPLIKKYLSIKEANILMFLSAIAGSAVVINKPLHLSITVLVILFLYIYNKFLKPLPLVGNIVVSIMVGLTIIYGNLLSYYMMPDVKIEWILFLFAFLINLLREIIKDAEDIEGDKKMGLSTLPILLGIKNIKIFTSILIIIISAVIAYPIVTGIYGNIYKILIPFIEIVLFFLVFKIIFAKERKDFSFISKTIKIIMLMGILIIFLDKLL